MSPSDSSSRIPILQPQEQGAESGQVEESTARTQSGIAERPSDATQTKVELPPDGRSGAVFQQWLASMATDAEAALAAAMSYREMSPEGREQWLLFLSTDAQEVDVPKIAIFAPLLAVEHDPDRRERLLQLLGNDAVFSSSESGLGRAMEGRGPQGERVYVLSTPLYLEFVQVLACAVRDGQFIWVRHDPIVKDSGAPRPGQVVGQSRLEPASVKSVLDDLASAILSHQRSGEPLPEALYVLAELLGQVGP